jgi:SNF2 family DNA or RNA helicase
MLLVKLTSLKVFVMNIEAIAFKKAYDLAYDIISNNKTLLVIDESTTIKNESAARTKAAIKLGEQAVYRRILTGEPIANSPMDIWAQAKFLDKTLLGFNSFFAFRAYYAKLGDIRVGHRTIKQVQGFRHIKELENSIASWSFRIKKDACLDLPPKIYQTYIIQMPPEQRKLYEQLKESSVVALSEQSVVTTPLAITKLLRLHQLACGHLVDDLGNVHTLNNNRITALLEVLAETEGKVIIWATYRKDIEQITKVIQEEYGKDSIATYFGDTNTYEREDAVTNFQDLESPVRFFLGNPKTGGYGLTLTAANLVVYYSNNYELEVRLQSEDRAHRIGQYKSVTYVDIVTEDSVDEKIIKALRSKKKISAEVLGDTWRDWI